MGASRKSSSVRRLAGSAARASAVFAGTAAATTFLVGRDLERGARRSAEQQPQHSGPFSDEEREATVRRYIQTLVRPADAFGLPFAEDVVRYENGIRTGFGRKHLQWDLFLHIQYSAIKEIEDLTLTVAPDGREGIIHAQFRIVTPFRLKVWVSEEFHIPSEDGLIHRIDARITGSRP